MARNKVFESSKQLRVACASTVDSGQCVIIGQMAGVALTDYDSHDGKATFDFGGVYEFSVKGVNNAGNVAVAVGDPLFYVSGDTPEISKKSSGTFIGYALDTVGSNVTATIPVRFPGTGQVESGYYGSNLFISTEQTGNGSAQSIAHGLGVAPAHVLVVLTEFVSTLSIDITEGTHTTTNVVVTVNTGAKYKVLAVAP